MSNSQMEYLETFARRSLDIVNKNYDDLFKNVKISLFCLFLYFVATVKTYKNTSGIIKAAEVADQT